MSKHVSDRVAEANRQNAQASTGPRTKSGKVRSSQNARKHGLSAASHTVVEEEQTKARIATSILSGIEVDAEVTAAAESFADACHELMRVRAYKLGVYCRLLKSMLQAEQSEDAPRAVQDALFALAPLERYERRAFSRRKYIARRLSEQLSLIRDQHSIEI